VGGQWAQRWMIAGRAPGWENPNGFAKVPGHALRSGGYLGGPEMRYSHTQHGRLHLLFHALALCSLVGAVLVPAPGPRWVLVIIAAVFALAGLSFGELRVEDEGEALLVRFGPVPLLKARIRYEDIASATAGRSRWIDGWGIHWVPWRGWTYNIWGFSCVQLELHSGKRIRIGTDEPAKLAEFLHDRLAERRRGGG